VTLKDGGDPNGTFSPFFPIGVAFEGIAKSVYFAKSPNGVGFDNITLGSEIPFTPTTKPTPLTKAQQRCVNEMNKNGARVNQRQLKENERCLKDFQKEKLGASMTFDACMIADRKDKVKKAREKTQKREGKKCDRLDVPPPFAYTGSATVNAAAVSGAVALAREIFGDPVPDGDLATKAGNKDKARCQLEMLRRANRLEHTVIKEIRKAKRKAIKDGAVDSGAALGVKLQAVFSSSNAKTNKTRDRFMKRVDKKCAALQAADMIFPGACGGKGAANLSEAKVCVIAAARCKACLKINLFDKLNLNCEQLDDQEDNGSCS
jgi:hypothetical protein